MNDNKNTYRILMDYGSEGMKYWDENGFETLEEAVHEALTANSAFSWTIVKVVKWEAKEIL